MRFRRKPDRNETPNFSAFYTASNIFRLQQKRHYLPGAQYPHCAQTPCMETTLHAGYIPPQKK